MQKLVGRWNILRTIEMKNIIRIFKSIEELSGFFAQKIVVGIQQTAAGNYYSIALSGGSTPRKVFEYIALHFKTMIDWQKILVFWSDERCVGPESDESNYRMAKESLLDLVAIPADNIFRIHGETDPFAEADRYSEIIRHHIPSEHTIPQIDLMMLGLGDDGHTASIFPENLYLFHSNKLCEVAVNPYSKQKRITLTGQVVNQARTIVFLVTGESKAEMVARIIEKKEGWEKLPASLVKPKDGELLWLLDEQAANKLNQADRKNEEYE
jgi:6-phosphogluconolactonase